MSILSATNLHTLTITFDHPIGMAQQRDIEDRILYPNRVILAADFTDPQTLEVLFMDGYREKAEEIVNRETAGLCAND